MNLILAFEENFLKINFNLLETNCINIIFILIFFFYYYQTSFNFTLLNRQKELIQIIENSQRDSSKTLELYLILQRYSEKIIFCLSFWKKNFKNEKINFIKTKYSNVIFTIKYFFDNLNFLIQAFNKKNNFILQNYFFLIIGSKILRIFFSFSEEKQLKISDFALNKFKTLKNE